MELTDITVDLAITRSPNGLTIEYGGGLEAQAFINHLEAYLIKAGIYPITSDMPGNRVTILTRLCSTRDLQDKIVAEAAAWGLSYRTFVDPMVATVNRVNLSHLKPDFPCNNMEV